MTQLFVISSNISFSIAIPSLFRCFFLLALLFRLFAKQKKDFLYHFLVGKGRHQQRVYYVTIFFFYGMESVCLAKKKRKKQKKNLPFHSSLYLLLCFSAGVVILNPFQEIWAFFSSIDSYICFGYALVSKAFLSYSIGRLFCTKCLDNLLSLSLL